MRAIWVTLNDDDESTETMYVDDHATDGEIESELYKTFGQRGWFAYTE